MPGLAESYRQLADLADGAVRDDLLRLAGRQDEINARRTKAVRAHKQAESAENERTVARVAKRLWSDPAFDRLSTTWTVVKQTGLEGKTVRKHVNALIARGELS